MNVAFIPPNYFSVKQQYIKTIEMVSPETVFVNPRLKPWVMSF
jgi:hypothetical protein